MTGDLRLYIDENITPEVAQQLRARGINAVAVRDLASLGDTDEHHLIRATDMNRVLVTCDQDFLMLAANGAEHAGIIFGTHQHNIGVWVRELELVCAVVSAEEMRNKVEFI